MTVVPTFENIASFMSVGFWRCDYEPELVLSSLPDYGHGVAAIVACDLPRLVEHDQRLEALVWLQPSAAHLLLERLKHEKRGQRPEALVGKAREVDVDKARADQLANVDRALAREVVLALPCELPEPVDRVLELGGILVGALLELLLQQAYDVLERRASLPLGGWLRWVESEIDIGLLYRLLVSLFCSG